MIESWAEQYASDMTDRGHIFTDLFMMAFTQIFDSEEHRRKYDNTLRLTCLKDLFDLISKAPITIKTDSRFADKCIKEIYNVFSNLDVAVSLYNHKARLKALRYDYYIPKWYKLKGL